MDSTTLKKEDILKNFGGTYINSLNNILQEIENDYEVDTIGSSHYYSPDNLPSEIQDKSSQLLAISLNAQSILAKFGSFDVMLKILNEKDIVPDVILIQESWLKSDELVHLVQIEGYTCINQGYKCSRHGGLITYIKSKFSTKILDICPDSQIWEGLFVEISSDDDNKKVIVGNIYKPPRDNNNYQNIQNFISEFDPVLTYLNNSKAELIIGGDWNINLLKINERPAFSDFLDKMLNNSLCPKITLPTRFSSRSASLIDNIYCKISDNTIDTISGVIFTGISDHLPYFVCIKSISKNKRHIPKYVKCKINKPEAINKFLEELHESNVYDNLNPVLEVDPNENYNKLIDHITTVKEKHLPYRFVKFNKHRHKGNKWITYGIINSLNTRDKKLQKLKQLSEGTPEYLTQKQNLSCYNTILKRQIREAKKKYYHDTFEKYKHDVKNTWKTISDILSKSSKKSNPIKEIKLQDKIIQDKTEICNSFNNFFVNIGPDLALNIKPSKNVHFTSYLKKVVTSSFHFDLVNEDDVIKITKSLKSKNSSGFDGISTNLLKMLMPAIIKPLTLILNQSLATGIFPDRLKTAKVIPLYKKDDCLIMDNYRPVSLLTSISKIFEKIVHKQITKYFKENKLFYKSQYGFRDEHSTELASVELIDRVMEAFQKKRSPLAIYMDLSKAFDTLDHKILTHKLEYYGIKGKELNWFKSYLSDRKQFVEIDSVRSDYQTITTGVPQGSVLGPLLFLIYMNDIDEASSALNSILFADDSTFMSTINAVFPNRKIDARFEENMNKELEKIYNWLAVNKLSLNARKTKYMLFHTKGTKFDYIPKIVINGTDIERVTNFNFLGLTINEKLSWKPHIDKIANKISKYSGVLCRLKNFLPPHILKTIYCSIIQSNLNYALLAWGFDCNRLIKLQKKIIRIISSSKKYNAHTEPLFKKLGLLKIEDMMKHNILKFYYKLKKNKVPAYFENYQVSNLEDIHELDTRFNQLFPANATRTHIQDKCLRNYLPEILNDTPIIILEKASTHSYKGFSDYAKLKYIEKYSNTCHIQNCYVCG